MRPSSGSTGPDRIFQMVPSRMSWIRQSVVTASVAALRRTVIVAVCCPCSRAASTVSAAETHLDVSAAGKFRIRRKRALDVAVTITDDRPAVKPDPMPQISRAGH
ncbi:hypothetical protein ABIF68_007312 [Bradyrhizobium japonicum]